MLGFHLDRKRQGTHYSDRMHRILGVCHACGILWHEEKVAFRNGTTEMHRVEDVRPVGSVLVTPQYEKYGLHVNPRVLPRLRSMGQQFAYALNVPATAVEIDGDIVYVRVPRPREEGEDTLFFEQAWAMAPDIPVGNLLLGADEEQQQLLLQLTSPTNVHAAVIGMTGSGKSTLMKTMILSAQMVGGAQVALFDPSGGFRPLSGHPAVWRSGLFRTAEECELGLEALARSLGREKGGLTYVFVDEVPELVRQRPQIKEHLGRLAQAGRHAGIHLILGAQHPLASELGSATLRNVPVRLVGRVADRTAAYNATGHSDSGAEHLRGRGDFLAFSGNTRCHFQAAIPSQALLEQWASRYPPRSPRLPWRATPEAETLYKPRPTTGTLAATEGEGGGGRPLDDIPALVIDEIARYVAREGKLPSPYWVRCFTRETVPSGGFYPPKARRAIREATRRYGLQLSAGERSLMEAG